MTMMSDVLFEAVMRDNIPAVQCILRIILNDDWLNVESVDVQEHIKNVYGRSVCLDVLAYLKGKDLVNIEVQQDPRGAHPKRLRYNASLIDAAKTIEAGQDFPELTNTYIIFFDVKNSRHMKSAMHHYVPTELETCEVLYDMGIHYIYVNGEYKGKDAMGMLISDMHQTSSAYMHIPELREAVKQIKEKEKGRDRMCEIMDALLKEEKMEERKQNARELYKNNVSLEIIAKSLHETVEQIEEWVLTQTHA